MTSLRRVLVVSLCSVIVLVSAVSAGFSYRDGVIEANELFDAKLAHSARVLMGLVDDALAGDDIASRAGPLLINVWKSSREGRGDELVSPQGHAYETKLAFQVWDDQHRLRLRSDSSPDQALAAFHPGFSEPQIGGERWRVFTLRSPAGLWYQSGEVHAIRDEMAEDIARGTLVPLLIEVPLVVLMVWLIVSWGLRALARVTRDIQQRTVDRLAPIDAARAPQEIASTVHAVNHLMARLDAALSRERRFTADAAHELRTPLAALQVHAENLQHAGSPEQRRESSAFVQQGIARLSRLVEQLLELSRLDPGAAPREFASVSLAAVVKQVLEEQAVASVARDLELAYEAPQGAVPVCGDELLLGLLVRNLADNAVRYTPPGGHVHIRLGSDRGATELVVEDSGPGIDTEARERVFARFHRELGTGQPGSGLGLSIVRQVAEIHRATVTLDRSPDLGGLRVRVHFRSPGSGRARQAWT